MGAESLVYQLLTALYDGLTALWKGLRDALATRTGKALAVLIVLAMIFGPETLAGWVVALGVDGVMRIIAGIGSGLATVATAGG